MSNYAPPCVIAWRCFWAIFAWPVLFVFLLLVLIGWGPEPAEQIWKDIVG